MTPTKPAGPYGRRAHLFVNNPHAGDYPDPTKMGKSYDILTAPEPNGYSVPVNRHSIGDGDVAVVYRVLENAVKRVPGAIVAIAGISSSRWENRYGYAGVNWKLQVLPVERWIHSAEMISSGLWTNHVPFTTQTQTSSPVELNTQQWAWITQRLPGAALDWLDKHAEQLERV